METLKLKPSIYILKESNNEYHVIHTATRKIKTYRFDHLVVECINSLRNESSAPDIIERLKNDYSPQDISDCIESLKDEGIIIEKSNYNPRFEKQMSFISELATSLAETENMQKSIESSKIAVFGVGGIGSWIVNGLSQIGVGEIRICDPDIVTISNLNRQLFYTSQDVGLRKAEVLSKKLPDSNIVPFFSYISSESNLDEIISGTNFIVNCADQPSVADTSKIIDKYARKHNIPYMVTGGYNMHLGMVGTIIVPEVSACFDCFLEHQKRSDPFSKLEVIKNVEDSGNLGPIAGAIANLQVMEIFKFLISKGDININKFCEIDFMNMGLEWRHYAKLPDCPTCSSSVKK
jgi:molybdopterin-synthase adenylyltransferase